LWCHVVALLVTFSVPDYERAWRAKERAEAEKKAAQLADILQSREQMAVQKQRVLSQAAQMEKEQFQRILQVCPVCHLPLRVPSARSPAAPRASDSSHTLTGVIPNYSAARRPASGKQSAHLPHKLSFIHTLFTQPQCLVELDCMLCKKVRSHVKSHNKPLDFSS
jgi:hypothetical protein